MFWLFCYTSIENYYQQKRCYRLAKVLDLNLTILELTTTYPELVSVLKDLGFEKITDPRMMQTAGRIMTIPKGCRMRKISMNTVKQTCIDHGFTIIEERRDTYE
ncbi:DUF1858 domain-containing protein [Niallia circulans]|uniref:DUF1858 domain-containing protein n=1 Tax=Niallia circulans TaxID=1397 RepID=UPI0039A038E5